MYDMVEDLPDQMVEPLGRMTPGERGRRDSGRWQDPRHGFDGFAGDLRSWIRHERGVD